MGIHRAVVKRRAGKGPKHDFLGVVPQNWRFALANLNPQKMKAQICKSSHVEPQALQKALELKSAQLNGTLFNGDSGEKQSPAVRKIPTNPEEL